MLFIVIETFRSGSPDAVGIRFREKGRMMPDDIRYVDSWMAIDGTTCYQIMNAESREALDRWIAGGRTSWILPSRR